ncbi:hypothetical protein protein, putative [Babesia ovis]|uniref:Uncharacterized protein n=1 Tax=Babesia ovis TaxID=5869 RepID=A0A9W5WUK3_BABOV|nr:hypothetical protein protein, putative [Babesia ovis]
MAEVSATKWLTVNESNGKEKTTEQVLLELQDLKDNIDFHMNNFNQTVKDILINARENVDPTELEHLKEACEKVEDTIRSTQASIKKQCDDMVEKYRTQENTAVPKTVSEKIDAAKKRIKQFVKDGVVALKESLAKLAKEFSTSSNDDSKTTQDISSEVTQPKEQTIKQKSKTDDDSQLNKDKVSQRTQSLVEVKEVSDAGHSSDSFSPIKTQNLKGYTQPEKAADDYDDSMFQDNLFVDGSMYKNANEYNDVNMGDKREETLLSNNNDINKGNEQNNANRLYLGNTQEEKGGETGGHGSEVQKSTNSGDSEITKKETDNIEKNDTKQAIDLSSVPATAITRTVNTYKQSMETEASKLKNEIQF